jgi:hypothetical protein
MKFIPLDTRKRTYSSKPEPVKDSQPDFDTFKRQFLARERRFPSGFKVVEVVVAGITDEIEATKSFLEWVKFGQVIDGKDRDYAVNSLSSLGFHSVSSQPTMKTHTLKMRKRGIEITLSTLRITELKW